MKTIAWGTMGRNQEVLTPGGLCLWIGKLILHLGGLYIYDYFHLQHKWS